MAGWCEKAAAEPLLIRCPNIVLLCFQSAARDTRREVLPGGTKKLEQYGYEVRRCDVTVQVAPARLKDAAACGADA